MFAHHHSFNVSVPLKVGRTAPMFVLSFFLHSILLVGSALDRNVSCGVSHDVDLTGPLPVLPLTTPST